MHVVILSDTETEGGASTATSRLSEALSLEHIRVTRIVGSTDGLKHPWATQSLVIDRWKKKALKVLNFASEALSRNIMRSLVSSDLDRLLAKVGPDVINVHNLHGVGWPIDLLRVCSSCPYGLDIARYVEFHWSLCLQL